MLKINTTSTNGVYNDFKAMLAALCGNTQATVLYRTDASTFFEVFGFTTEVGIRIAISGTKPGTFDADFPGALQISTTYVMDFS